MPPRQAPDFAGLFSNLKTALTEMVEDAVKEGARRGADGFLGVLQENATGVVHRIAGARSKVTRRAVAAAAPLERRAGVDVVVEGEPRKRKTKTKARSARRS